MMDIRAMLEYLIRLGFTEYSIARQINAHQSTISRILSGHIKDPRSSIAFGVKYLFELELRKRELNLNYLH